MCPGQKRPGNAALLHSLCLAHPPFLPLQSQGLLQSYQPAGLYDARELLEVRKGTLAVWGLMFTCFPPGPAQAVSAFPKDGSGSARGRNLSRNTTRSRRFGLRGTIGDAPCTLQCL